MLQPHWSRQPAETETERNVVDHALKTDHSPEFVFKLHKLASVLEVSNMQLSKIFMSITLCFEVGTEPTTDIHISEKKT